MPFIRKVCVLSKTRLIFPHLNGPNVTPLNDKRLRKKFKVDSGKAVAGSSLRYMDRKARILATEVRLISWICKSLMVRS